MKRIILAIAAVMVLCLPASAFAQNVGYQSGFFVQNDDGTFKLVMNGRGQPKFNLIKQSNNVLDWSDPTGRTFLPSKQMSFSIRRAEMKFSTFIHENVVVRLGLKHSTNSQNFATINATGATVSYTATPYFTVTTGMVGLPLDMITDTSSAWLLLPEPPITTTQDDGLKGITPLRSSFGAPDGLGINFAGDFWKFFYSLSVVNGTESNYNFNPNMRVAAGLRVGFNILDPVPGSQTDFECSSKPKLTVSMGANYSPKQIDPNTNADINYKLTSSLGVGLRWGGFSFTTEGYARRTKLSNPGTALWARPTMDDIGYYANAGYYVIPQKLELALQAAQIFREGPDNNSHEFSGGLNWYIKDNNMKLQASFSWSEDFDDIFGQENNNVYTGALMLSVLF